MSRVAFQLPDTVFERLQKLAARTGRSETEYMIEAIREYLDDLEDLHLAEQRLKDWSYPVLVDRFGLEISGRWNHLLS